MPEMAHECGQRLRILHQIRDDDEHLAAPEAFGAAI